MEPPLLKKAALARSARLERTNVRGESLGLLLAPKVRPVRTKVGPIEIGADVEETSEGRLPLELILLFGLGIGLPDDMMKMNPE